MKLSRLALLLALTTAACGGKHAAAPVDNRGSAAAGDPTATLDALAKAIESDDGAALAAVVDPTHGLTLWHTPGAGYGTLITVKPGDTTPPSKLLAAFADAEGPEGYAAEHYWPSVKTSIRDGLAKLDVDPANPDDEVYGTCADEEREVRAYLVHGRDDAGLRSMDLGGDGEVAPEAVIHDLVQFHNWGFSAYLLQREGGWRVVHLVLTEPCSA